MAPVLFLLCLVVFVPDQAGGVRVGAFHVAAPFAGPSHVVLGQAVVLQEGAFDQGVDPALQPVGGALHRPALGESGFQEGEEPAVLEQSFQPAVAAAHLLVGPPPGSACGLGVMGVVLGQGAFVDEVPPPLVPGVEGLAPPGRPLRVVDPGEPVEEPLEFPVGLQSWSERQVGLGVAFARAPGSVGCGWTAMPWRRPSPRRAAHR